MTILDIYVFGMIAADKKTMISKTYTLVIFNFTVVKRPQGLEKRPTHRRHQSGFETK